MTSQPKWPSPESIALRKALAQLPEDAFLTTTEVALILRPRIADIYRVYAFRKGGLLEGQKYGGKEIRFRAADVRQFLVHYSGATTGNGWPRAYPGRLLDHVALVREPKREQSIAERESDAPEWHLEAHELLAGSTPHSALGLVSPRKYRTEVGEVD